MPRYSDPRDPHDAVLEFSRMPGNYILWDRWGGAYAGRQSEGVDRLRAHLRKRRRGDIVAVEFMRDGFNDPCVRASRELATVDALLDAGVRVRNKVRPSTPRRCKRR